MVVPLAALCIIINLASGFSSAPYYNTNTNNNNNNFRHTFGVTHGTTTTPNPLPQRIIMPSSTTVTQTTTTLPRRMMTSQHTATAVRGGADVSSATPPRSVGDVMASAWAVTGLSYILLKAVKRVLPAAMEPFRQGAVPLTAFQWGAYALTCLFFAYAEGYKGFQKKFSPLCVSRAMRLRLSVSTLHHVLLGPFYAMGLFHATPKRMTVSWGVTVGVAAIVAVVKRLSYPWRSIVDAGVIVGLSWGTASILLGYGKALFWGVDESVDPCFPVKHKGE